MQDYAKLMNQVALNTFDLLENLLDWSRLQRGLLKPEPMEITVNDLVMAAIGPFEHKAKSRNLLVNIQVESGLKVEVDKRMMETIIRNLYTNALKFTPHGGVITLKAETTRDSRLLLCVSDSGIGIPESLLPMLFTVNEDKNRQGLAGERSSGLGLMLCKEFIELHNGTINVQTAVNKGSTFCINLPCQFNATTV
jgi:signal transduction histidine kinase